MNIQSPPTPPLNPPLGEKDHILGPANARLVLVEYGDYECPHCKRAASIVDAIIAKFGNELTFGFRHFPLGKIHRHARLAAQAAEAAGAQGKFWQMHAQLFAHQDALEAENLASYAAELGLDVARFEKELADGIYVPRIQEDISGGVRSGVNGTPTFFIQNKRFNGGYELESLVNALKSAQ
jgi:protein-disulfide isomerase